MVTEYNVCLIPRRYVLVILMAMGVMVSYILRICLVVAMKHVTPHSTIVNDSDNECNFTEARGQFVAVSGNLYDWDRNTQLKIKSAFFYSALVSCIPGGVISDKYGGKYVLGSSILFASIVTLLTPKVVEFSGGHFSAMMVSRICTGLGIGMVFPCLNSLLSNWAPARERCTLSSIPFASTQLSTVINHALTNYMIMKSNTWSTPYYVYGSIGIAWSLVWHLTADSAPWTSSLISQHELDYLKREMEGHITRGKKSIPWWSMLSSVPLWALIITHIGHIIMWRVMLNELPTYMNDILKFDILHSALWTAVPYTVMIFMTLTSGWFADYVILKEYIHVTTVRKIFTTFGAMGPAIFLVVATYSGCHRFISILMITVGLALMSFYYAGTRVNTLELAPNFSGVIMGLCNALATFVNIAVPYFVHQTAIHKTVIDWRNLFYILFILVAFTNVVFMLFGSGKEQSWNMPKSENVPNE